MQVHNYLREQRYSLGKMQKINLAETKRFFLDVYCLEPGQTQKPHKHEKEDKLYVVVEGVVRVTVDGEARNCLAGDVVLCNAGAAHGIQNVGEDRAAVLAFMAPHPNPARG